MSITAMTPRDRFRRHAIATNRDAVLIVDDDAEFRSILATRLEHTAGHFDQAASMHAAIDAIERNHYDLVLSDYSAPQVNGTALLAYLTRRGFAGRSVLMSASLPPEASAEAEDPGAQTISKWDLLDIM